MSDMTQSFIEMVEAFKAKPELEAQIASLKADNAMCYGTIDQLRFEIETLKSEKTDLSTRLRRLRRSATTHPFAISNLTRSLAELRNFSGWLSDWSRRVGKSIGRLLTP